LGTGGLGFSWLSPTFIVNRDLVQFEISPDPAWLLVAIGDAVFTRRGLRFGAQ
jgi:hypothetical protein